MGLRKKALIFAAVALVVYAVAVLVVVRVLLLGSLAEIEVMGARENLARVRSAVQQEIANLDSTTRDYASWDRTYEFARARDASYVRTELVDESLRNLRIEVVLIIDERAQLVVVKSLNEYRGRSLDGELLRKLKDEGAALLRGVALEEGTKGLISHDGEVLLFAVRPVLTSEHHGPARGTMLMARLLDDELVQRLADNVHLPLKRLPWSWRETPRVREELTQAPDGLLTVPSDEMATSGYVALRDSGGAVAAVLKTELPRSVYQQGRRAGLYFLAVILLMAGILGFTILAALEYGLLHPLARLSATARHVTETGDLSARVPMRKSSDEVETLAAGLNNMLDALTHSQAELVRARERLQFEASHDTLTGVWNRGAILELLEKELARGIREGQWTTLMMVDADRFKEINDTFGHATGDQALRSLGGLMGKAVRSYDAIGRYGGEEFVIVAPHCNATDGAEMAERVRRAVEEHPFFAGGKRLPVTVSIGVASGFGATADELCAAADEAMYESKKKGRNCVTLSPALTPTLQRWPRRPEVTQ